jgi:hypothetical protein
MVLAGHAKVLNESAIAADTKVPPDTNVHLVTAATLL